MSVSASLPIIMGIPNCDSVRKARQWLDSQSISYKFRDIRQQPLSSEEMAQLIGRAGAATVVNRRSSSWRALDEADRVLVTRAIEQTGDHTIKDALVRLMCENQTMIKRPVLCLEHHAGTGFSPSEWAQLFAGHV